LSLHFRQVIVRVDLSGVGMAPVICQGYLPGLFVGAADGVEVSIDRQGAGWEKINAGG
jgi:hypothetical protein